MRITKKELNEVIGYGINERGACSRSGSLRSFDHSFDTYANASAYQAEVEACGYGNTLTGIVSVTALDEIWAEEV